MFQESQDCLNLVHYNTRDQHGLTHQLEDVLGWAGPLCDGIQLNIAWPDPRAIQSLRLAKPRVKIVLQINRGAMEACDNDAIRVASRVGEQYASLVDYVLVDFSGGKGEPFEPIHTMAYLAELKHQRECAGASYQLVVAGGLCAENLNRLLAPITQMIPSISIDAEGGIRTDDTLDIEKVLAYLEAAKSFFIRSDARF
jgi:phosphoribosylanthranilate isomerase